MPTDRHKVNFLAHQTANCQADNHVGQMMDTQGVTITFCSFKMSLQALYL